MSDTFHRPLAHRVRALLAATGTTALLAALIAALILVNDVGPDSWWPRTGEAFAATPTPATPAPDALDRCAYIVGPARDYCLRAAPAPKPQASAPDRSTVPHLALLLLPVAAAATLTTRRRRTR
ncbi:hypothetical protein [Streptomyces sp. S1]|uniref:hypothetical protein n=1 Tax=unclassified Streptomyces TaxID=2593676 RepID=UPI000EF813CE|nr:hypothetical protein [Streptomyces sp. S1]